MRIFLNFCLCFSNLFFLGLSCSKGFMDTNLLVTKAAQIPNTGGTLTTLAESQDTRWVLTPEAGCTNGMLTQVILGIDIRSSISGSRDQYPSIEIWSRGGNTLTRQSLNSYPNNPIRFTPENFTTSGMYRYTFPSPITLNSNYRIGIYQPADERSVVRIYRISGTSNVDRVPNNLFNSLSYDRRNDVPSQYSVLILPITNPTDCFTGFLTENDITSYSQSITSVIGVTDTRVFPDISITCNNSIYSWIVGTNTIQNDFPIIQLRRSSTLYTVLTIDTNNGVLMNTNVYQFTLDNPIEVQAGDILVINSTGISPMYYQQFNGPPNYAEINGNGVLSLLTANDYPLISPVMDITTSSSILMLTSAVSDLSSIMNSLQVSPTNNGVENTNGNSGVIAGVVTTLILLLLAGIITTLVIIVLIYFKRRKYRVGMDPNRTTHSNIFNPTYTSFRNTLSSVKTFFQDPLTYEEPAATQFQPDGNGLGLAGGVDQPIYHDLEMSLPPSVSSRSNTLNMRLPTPPVENEGLENPYEDLPDQQELYSSLAEEPEFFPEEQIYWEPGSDTTDIYEQLSSKKYREIIRSQIKLTTLLGQGQFGTVHQGVWDSPGVSDINVAVKTLKDDTSEEEKIKFLQEAAIMGQFHHPNVVKLHGVVTIGEPTMIVLELISGGDLREYLQQLQPSQGELVQSTVPGLLLNFCRQVAAGMDYLSRKCFVHRDLAARNILVNEQSICKISDFGMSRDVQEDVTYYMTEAKKIPIKWTAPEALQYRKYTTASDVWSFGVLMYEIWSLGHKPFESYTHQECMRLVESGYRLPPPPGCPRPLYKIMIQCWHPQPNGRPPFLQLIGSLNLGDDELLRVTNSTVLGGPLEDGHSLYTDLQNTYKK